MSFKQSISAVSISNDALALLPQGPIASMDENSLAAQECSRTYGPVVAELLEMHHWGLATVRGALASVVNDRPAEWLYAYAKPDDMAFPVMMIPDSGVGYYGWVLRDGAYWLPTGLKLFAQVGDTIYSSVVAATLEYTSFDITEANFTSLFKYAVVIELASRICMPVTKNDTRTRELMAQAEQWRGRVIANDTNRNNPTYGDRLTESAYARFGGFGLPAGYALDPVQLPAANTGY